MKFFHAFVFGLCAIALAGRCVAAQPSPITNTVSNFAESELIETWGWFVAQQEEVAGIEIKASELASWLKGFSLGIRGASAPCDLSKASPDLERLSKARREKLMRAIERRNEGEAKKFFAALKKIPGVIALPGGLRYEILKPGSGEFPKPRQTVNVHYTARLVDGMEFAQFGPMNMVLVTNHAPFPAWVDGLQKINVGGVLKLYMPPPLPEKDAFRWGIPPGSAMVFEVELLDVRDTTEQEMADELVPPAPELELPASGYTTAQLFGTWGWNVGRKTRAAQFNLNEAQLAALTDGIKSGVLGKPSRFDLQRISPAVEKFVNDHREQAWLAAKQKQLEEMDALFTELKRNTNVVELADGLRYEILQPGSGPFPKTDQFVKVNYIGRLIDGRIFDQTDPTLGPLDIKVGTVIAGWSEGVQKINKDGKIKLYIPPALGYGEVGTGGIPPNSTLIFEIELLDIRDSLGDDPTPAAEKQADH